MLVATALIAALAAQAAYALDNGLGRTPQMGFNSWNHYHCGVNETVMLQAIQAIHDSGLQDAGYIWTGVDDCWASYRDGNGVIHADNVTFPHGLSALADAAHKLGQKFGTYTCVGPKTCAGRPGSYQYEDLDAQTYASWGIDYVKVDNCYDPSTPEERYPVFTAAWNKTGRPIFFAACEWGVDNPSTWMPQYANSWRTTTDIQDNWASIMNNMDINEGLYLYAGPGGWNQPDMLEVGNGGCSNTEYVSHFSLWALMKAPLLVGCDVTNMDEATKAILLNDEVIAVDQDLGGVQGRRVWSAGIPDVAGVRRHPGFPMSDGAALDELSGLFATNSVVQKCSNRDTPTWTMDASGNIRNSNDGRCLDIDCCDEDAVNNVSVYPCHDAADEELLGDDTFADGLSYADARRRRAHLLRCSSCGDSNQEWEWVGSTLRTKLDGQCLTAIPTASALNPLAVSWGMAGWNVATAPCVADAANQTWYNSSGTLESAIATSSCLRIYEDVPAGSEEVWAAPMQNGDFAVGLFNRGDAATAITANWTDIGLSPDTVASVRDLWAHSDNGTAQGSLTATVDSHGFVLVRLTPQSA